MYSSMDSDLQCQDDHRIPYPRTKIKITDQVGLDLQQDKGSLTKHIQGPLKCAILLSQQIIPHFQIS